MAKYFLGSVGKAEAFRKNAAGQLELAFVSKTLTDSGLNISTTKDDIRAGQGAPIQFSFYHDPSVEITLTDVLWKPEYLEAQLGARFVVGSEDYKTEEIEFTNGVSNNTYVVNKMKFPCGEDYMVWGAKQGTDKWETIKYQSDNKFHLDDTSFNGKYCVRYLAVSNKAKIAEIGSIIIPEELFLLITAPIFAGDACSASRGKAAGHITFEVPRFQLNGAQEFAMNMSSNQTMSLAGIAMASESAECDAVGGRLLRIIEVLDDRNYLDEVIELVADSETSVKGKVPAIYGIIKGEMPIKLDNAAQLEFTPALAAGKYSAAGNCVIKLKRSAELPVIQITESIAE